MMNDKIKSIMTVKLVKIEPTASLNKVKHIFDTVSIHHLPVTEGDSLLGLVTTYDLWKLDISFEDYNQIKVSEIMTKEVTVISPEESIGSAAELFLSNHFHALPVVENQKLVGIITSFDILKYEFKKEYTNPILFKEVLEGSINSKA